jgi:hypothetical protein
VRGRAEPLPTAPLPTAPLLAAPPLAVLLLGALLLAALLPAPLAGQASGPHRELPSGTGEVATVNAVLGAAVAALSAGIRGEDVPRAFVWGAAGGALSFGGKYLAGRRPYWGGLAGRQISELGNAVAVNAARGDPVLDELWLAMGPVRVRVRNAGAHASPALRINAFSTFAAVEYLVRHQTHLLLHETLATGVLVFDAPNHVVAEENGAHARGIARGSVVVLSGAGDFDRRATLGHELVHVLQADFVVHRISAPLERGARRGLLPDAGWLDAVEVSSGLQLFNFDPFYEHIEEEALRLQRRPSDRVSEAGHLRPRIPTPAAAVRPWAR